MSSTTFRVLLYALVAATSPLALGATLAVLRSRHARINGLAFAIGFVATQAAVCLLAFVFDAASLAELDDSQHTFGSVARAPVRHRVAVRRGLPLATPAPPRGEAPGPAHPSDAHAAWSSCHSPRHWAPASRSGSAARSGSV